MENTEKKTPYAPDSKTRVPLEHYMALFAEADPAEITARTGVPYDEETKSFHLTELGRVRTITWPEFNDEGWNDTEKIFFMRYLLEGKKAAEPTKFLTYREMPWGEVYEVPFNGRCVKRLAGTFGFQPDNYKKACELLGATPFKNSGIAYEITFMENLLLHFILWEGDDEFPASAQIIFSDNFADVFAAEDRVVACELTIKEMTKRLKEQ